MTNPMGCSFLSYKRERKAEAELLIDAQHDLGIPTWRDVSNLDELPAEDEIRRTLRDPETANAILWLTPEIARSEMVRKVEAPLILDRARQDSTFFVVPAAAGGLDYAEAASLLDSSFTLEDLKHWNVRKVAADPIGPREAAEIATRVLRRRIAAIHENLPAGAPIKLVLHTRKAPASMKGALTLSWLHRFDGREAKPGAWDETLLPALKTVVQVIEEVAPGRSIEASGLACVPAIIALGCECLAPRRLRILWEQYTVDRDPQLWSLQAPREESGFEIRCQAKDLGGRDLAVLVYATDDVGTAFKTSRAGLPSFRALLEVYKAGEPPHDLESPGQAAELAYKIQREVRKALKEYPEVLCIHLFTAVPLGLAMMIGQLLNNVSAVQTYELITGVAGKIYQPAALLHPSD